MEPEVDCLRPLQAVALLGTVALAAHALGVVEGHAELFDKWVFFAVLAASAVPCLLRAWSDPRERLAWLVLGSRTASRRPTRRSRTPSGFRSTRRRTWRSGC